MADQMIFKRYEIKYKLTTDQYHRIMDAMSQYMRPDEHGQKTIMSLYFDTPDWILVRRSLDKPDYKEKLRLRSYGLAGHDTEVYLELKKKYDGVVYKRRFGMKEADMWAYLTEGKEIPDSQIKREIDYTLSRYTDLKPRVLLCYDREAFYAKDDHEFRITFDQNIRWRDTDVNLTTSTDGEQLLEPGQVLMEVKVGNAMPLWFVKLLSDNKLYKTSFSKYGTAYKTIYNREHSLMEETENEYTIHQHIRHNSGNTISAKIPALRVC